VPRKTSIYCRFDVDFLLSDSRFVLLTDSQKVLYLQLQAIALQERRELLTARFNAKEIAFQTRRDEADVAEGLEALSAESCGLIRIEAGRIRVVGVRKHHSEKLNWRDEEEQSRYSNDTTVPRHVPEDAERYISGHDCSLEKRREEKNRTDNDSCGPRRGEAAPRLRISKPESVKTIPDELRELPLYASDQRLAARFGELMGEWAKRFPEIDVLREIGNAHAWEMARQPRDRKKDRPRFLTTWMLTASKDARKGKPPPPVYNVGNRNELPPGVA
jgi:hypothetical protein